MDSKSDPTGLLKCGEKSRDFFEVSQSQKIEILNRIKTRETRISALPTLRYPEYLLLDASSDRYVYVDNLRYQYDYNKARLYVGKTGEMQEKKIKGFFRYRDGGTTVITTTEGEIFFSPSYSSVLAKTHGYGSDPAFINSEGVKSILQRVNIDEFDFSKLGIPDPHTL